MATSYRYTTLDLERFPDDGKRREIIDGELFVSKVPHDDHQALVMTIGGELYLWNRDTGLGQTRMGPGVVFSDADAVIPDVIWIGGERFRTAIDASGHFQIAPDLAVEVLSRGSDNERRDRVAKLGLYSQRGVLEYWIVDRFARQVEVYRRAPNVGLQPSAILRDEDSLTSPILPGFELPLARLFADVSAEGE
jgi:Uma2 family endonuclease